VPGEVIRDDDDDIGNGVCRCVAKEGQEEQQWESESGR
jgi:hypothetical protein